MIGMVDRQASAVMRRLNIKAATPWWLVWALKISLVIGYTLFHGALLWLLMSLTISAAALEWVPAHSFALGRGVLVFLTFPRLAIAIKAAWNTDV